MGSRRKKDRIRAEGRPKPSAGVLPARIKDDTIKNKNRPFVGSITLAARKRVAKSVASKTHLGPDVANADYWAFSYMPNFVTTIEGTSKAKLDMDALRE